MDGKVITSRVEVATFYHHAPRSTYHHAINNHLSKARCRPKDSWLERLQDCKKVRIEARTPEARNSLQWCNQSTTFIDIFKNFKFHAHILFKQIVKNLIIFFNEEIYDSIQKLVHYLPQMKALHKCKNCNN